MAKVCMGCKKRHEGACKVNPPKTKWIKTVTPNKPPKCAACKKRHFGSCS